MEIVDPHHHLWDLELNRYPWLSEDMSDRGWGDLGPLKKSYRVADLLADAEAAGVTLLKSVHVQANYDPSDPVGETIWLEKTAANPASRGFPHGIVGFADLSAPDVDSVLAAHCAHGRIRGIRQVLNRHPDPRLNRAPKDFLTDPAWRRGLSRLADHELSFDVQVYHHQMAAVADVVAENPDITFILDHAGMPAERDDENLAGWHEGIARLAAAPNMVVKLSGFGMVETDWTASSIRPFVLHCIESFGPERAMFASNFPVDRLMATYGRLWAAYDEIVSDFTTAERYALFRGTAERTYRI